MLFDSDEECDITSMLDDDEEDDDDDDYIPGKRDSDSDPEYGKRKKKSSRSTSRYVPGKRNRTSSSSSNTQKNLNKSDDLNSDEITDKSEVNEDRVTTNVSEHLSSEETDDNPEKNSPVKGKAIKSTPIKMKTAKLKTKSPRVKKPKKSYSEETEETPFSLRRSGRGSRTRAVSYADADVSEEDMFEDEDLFETFRDTSNEKAKATKKRHVDDLWSKFKTDVNEKEKPVEKGEDNPISSENICNKSPTSTPTELNCENDDSPVLVNKPLGTPLENSDAAPVESTEKKEIEKTSILKKDNIALEEKFHIEVDNSNHCKNLDENNKKSLSPTISIEEKQMSTSLPAKHIEETSIVKDHEKSNPNGNFKGELSITKNDSLKEPKPIENLPMNIFVKRDVVVVDEKGVLAGSSSSPNKDLKSISQELKETKTQLEPFIMKTNTVRSAGISNFLSSGVKKSGGLSSVLNTIEKKKKISVLDKTKCDWDNYKSEEDIEEELRGNRHAGYLDRQEFLQRVDYKQWENEREMRLYTTRK